MKKKYFMKTILTIILLVITLTSIHFINHLRIQRLEYTDKWGDELRIKEVGGNSKTFLSSIEDKILNVTIENTNTLNFQIINTNGELEEKGSKQLDNYDNIKVKYINLIEDKLIYLYEDDIYVSEFNNNQFSNTKKIIQNVKNMNAESNKENIIITTINKEDLRVYELDNTEVTNIYEGENNWDLKDVIYRQFEDKEYVFSITNDGYGIEKLVMIPISNEQDELILRETNNYLGYNIKNFNIDYLDEKVIITYILNLNNKGIQSNEIEYSKIDLKTLEIDNEKIEHSNYKIGNLRSDIDTYISNNDLHIIGSGLNRDNKYTQANDIFDFTIESDGKIKELEFISTTQEYSIETDIAIVDNDVFINFKDIISGSYNLNIIGTDDDFINREKDNIVYYRNALIRSITSPFIAVAFTILRGFILLIILIIPIAIVYMIYLRRNNEKDNIKAFIIIGIYIITNIVAYKFLYYQLGNIYYYPEILLNKSWQIFIPIIINLLSAITLYVFYKEGKKNDIYMPYVMLAVFFIAIDIYFNNILYAPFEMIEKLI